MNRKNTTELMRLLQGELSDPVAQQLQQRLRQEPELRRELESLEQLWHSLELPEPDAPPPGFATRVLARARQETESTTASPWWNQSWAGKATAILVLAAGIALGAALASPGDADEWSGFLESEPTMAESYVMVVEQSEDDSWRENGS